MEWEPAYWIPASWQTLSYKLDDDLESEARMDFWNFDYEDRLIDTANNENILACSVKVGEADAEQRKKGCTTLEKPVGCIQVYLPGSAPTGEPGLQPEESA